MVDGDGLQSNEAPKGAEGVKAPEPTTEERIAALKDGKPDPAVTPPVDEKKPEGEEGEQGKEEKPDPDDLNTPKPGETVAQMIERRAAEMAEEKSAAEEADRIATAEANKAAALQAKLDEAFTVGATEVAKKFLDEEGKPTLSPEDLQAKVFDPLNGVFDQVRETYQAEAFDQIVAAGLDVIPEDQHESFLAATVDKGLSPADWLKQAIEHGAQTSAAWKAREKEHATEKTAALEEGFVLGKKPGASGQASQQNGSNPAPVVTTGKSASEIAAMQLSSEDLAREIKRLSATTA